MKEYRYKAFISYRHLKLDKAVAIKLHKMLEAFRPPKGIANEKKWKIFRDEAELPTSNDLSSDIREALQNSEFLIVLCSRSTGESRWCLEEMSYFKELHGMRNDHIITLLVEGTPQESFPRLICVTRQEYTDEYGNSAFRDVEVEPLAANVVADTQRQSMRKLKDEFLRIAAPLAGCSFAQLYNRERRQKARRLLAATSSVMILAVAFGLYNKQMRNSVEEQLVINEQMRKSVEEQLVINEQMRSSVEEQLLLQKIENARFLTADSQRLFKDGETLKAIQSAYEALPQEGEERPALAKTEHLLAQELGAFEEKSFVPIMALKHDFPVEQIAYLCDGERLVTKDKKAVYLWNAQTGECVASYPREVYGDYDGYYYSYHLYVRERHLIDNADVIKTHPGIYISWGYACGLISANLEKAQEKRELYVEDADCFYLSDYDKTYRVDALTGEAELLEEKKDYFLLNGQMYRKDRSYFISSLSDAPVNDKRIERLGDDGSVIKTWDIAPASQGEGDLTDIGSDIILIADQAVWVSIDFGREVLSYSVTNGYVSPDNPVKLFDAEDVDSSSTYKTLNIGDRKTALLCTDIPGSMDRIEVRLYSTDTSELLWRYNDDELWLDGMNAMEVLRADKTQNDKDILVVLAGNKCVLLDVDTGENIHTYTFEREILNYYYTEDGNVFLLMADGREILIKPVTMAQKKKEGYRLSGYQTHAMPAEIVNCAYSDRQYAANMDGSNSVYIFKDQDNPDYEELFSSENSIIKQVILNASGSKALINCYSSIYLYDFESREQKLLYKTSDDHETLIVDWKFAGDDTVAGGDEEGNLLIYDVESGRMVRKLDKEDGTRHDYSDFQVSNVDGLAAYKEDSSICIVGKNLEKDKKLTHEEENSSLRTYQASPDFSKMAAVYSRGWTDVQYDAGIWDTESEKWTALQTECTAERKVEWIFWAEDSMRLALGYTDNTVEIFNAGTGAAVMSLDFPDYKPVSCHIGGEYIYVLCEDGTMQQIDDKGNLVRSVLLERENIQFGDSVIRIEAGVMLACEELAGQNMLMVSLTNPSNKDTDRWFINKDEFEPRFFVKDCYAYLESCQKVLVRRYGKLGLYPLYTTEQLKDKAEMILEKLDDK